MRLDPRRLIHALGAVVVVAAGIVVAGQIGPRSATVGGPTQTTAVVLAILVGCGAALALLWLPSPRSRPLVAIGTPLVIAAAIAGLIYTDDNAVESALRHAEPAISQQVQAMLGDAHCHVEPVAVEIPGLGRAQQIEACGTSTRGHVTLDYPHGYLVYDVNDLDWRGDQCTIHLYGPWWEGTPASPTCPMGYGFTGGA